MPIKDRSPNEVTRELFGVVTKYFEENKEEFPRHADSYTIVDYSLLVSLIREVYSLENGLFKYATKQEQFRIFLLLMMGKKIGGKRVFIFNKHLSKHKEAIFMELLGRMTVILNIRNSQVEKILYNKDY